jgi:hypothetical protein
MGKWISITDRLPKKGKLVVCGNINDDWVVAGEIGYDGNWYNQFEVPGSDAPIYPTHWRPMPSFQGPTENYVLKGDETYK